MISYLAVLLSVIFHVPPPLAVQQAAKPLPLPDVGCYQQDDPRGDPIVAKRKLWDGYEVSLGPTPRHGVQPEIGCTAAIYDAAGKVVFRTTGYAVVFDQTLTSTNFDFDGDGKPDAIFETDAGGGNRCCWAFNVISLSPKPHKLFDLWKAGYTTFEKDDQGHVLIWKGIFGSTKFTSEALRPYAQQLVRFRDGHFVDVTPELCSSVFSDAKRYWHSDVLTSENVNRLQSSREIKMESEEIASALISRIMQHVVCHQFELALIDVELWPKGSKEQLNAELAQSEALANYPQFVRRLVKPSEIK